MTEQITRRQAITASAAIGSVVVAGGLVWRARSAGVGAGIDDPPYAPWDTWRSDRAEGPMALVQAAILASNAHNAQPWRFEVSEDRIAVHADPERNIGPMDPFRREMVLSLGCAVENMVLAGESASYACRVVGTPGQVGPNEGADGEPVAVIHLTPDARTDHLMVSAITARQTNRGPYAVDWTISEPLKREMIQLAERGAAQLHLFDTPEALAELSRLTVEATQAIIADRPMAEASADWFRFRYDEILRHRDGVTLDGLTLPALLNAAAKMLPPPSIEEADRQWLDATRDTHTATAPLYGVISVEERHGRQALLDAGRLWQRLHLWAETRGLGAHPLNQVPERIDRETVLDQRGPFTRVARDLVEATDRHPSFLFRMGYPVREARLSPRRAASEVASAA